MYSSRLRIPEQACHLIHAKAATHSTGRLPPIPEQSCHPGGVIRPTGAAAFLWNSEILPRVAQRLPKAVLVEKRFSPEVLTNPAGFAGIDGIFRFRSDGANERGLAVMRVTPTGGEIVSPAPRAFATGR